MMHPIEDLNARVTGEIGQCHPPAFVDDNQANRSVEATALWGTPGEYATGMDRADKLDGRIDCQPPRGSNLDASGARGAGGGLTRRGEVQIRDLAGFGVALRDERGNGAHCPPVDAFMGSDDRLLPRKSHTSTAEADV
jgi:hypothetical protein